MELLEGINFLNLTMLDEFEGHLLYRKATIFVVTLLAFILLLIPLVNLGVSIYQFSTFKTNRLFKFTFLSTTVLGFITALIIKMQGLKLGYGIVLYIALSLLALLYSYISELITKERVFNGLRFGFHLSTIIGIVFLLMIGSTSLFKTKITYDSIYSSNRVYYKLNQGDMASLVDSVHFYENREEINSIDDEITLFTFSHLYGLYSQEMMEDNRWVPYVGSAIGFTHLAVLGLLLAALVSELRVALGHSKRKFSLIYLWGAFVVEMFVLVLAIIFKEAYMEVVRMIITDGVSFQLSMTGTIIALPIITLMLALYKTIITIISKDLNNPRLSH